MANDVFTAMELPFVYVHNIAVRNINLVKLKVFIMQLHQHINNYNFEKDRVLKKLTAYQQVDHVQGSKEIFFVDGSSLCSSLSNLHLQFCMLAMSFSSCSPFLTSSVSLNPAENICPSELFSAMNDAILELRATLISQEHQGRFVIMVMLLLHLRRYFYFISSYVHVFTQYYLQNILIVQIFQK